MPAAAALTSILSGLIIASALAASHVEFSDPTNFAAGNDPNGIAVGDFNGDLDPDLAVTNFTSSDVSILLGAAGGTFTGPTSVPLPGAGPEAAVVADFNGDSDPDIATANSTSDNVSILLGAAGATFTGPTTAGAGTDPIAIAVGQFNPPDTDPDLVVANQTGDSVTVLLGAAGGTFTGPTPFTTDDQPFSVAVGDFNGDGDPDLATANTGGGSHDVSVLLGVAGGGSFGVKNDFPLLVGSAPSGIAVGDFNADNDPDLAVTNFFLDRLSVLRGDAGGTFSPEIVFPAGRTPSGIAVGDLNGDTDPDVAVTNEGAHTLSVLLGVPGASFQGPTSFATNLFPNTVAVGDFNADAKPDLAVSNGASTDDASVLLQTSLASGPQGPAGVTGPTGPQGPPGRDATVICKAKGRGKARPKCIVLLTATAASSRASARLGRNGRTYARGSAFVSEGANRVPLIAVRPVPSGRYWLTVKVSDRDGKVTVTKRRVAVG